MAEASILPASCADLRILMENYSEVTGRVVDARGEPIRNATFHLSGHGRSLSENRFSLASLRESAGWAGSGVAARSTHWTITLVPTATVGSFFGDVYPGWYYLSSDISELNENFKITLPNTYYPGVYGWLEAKHLVVEEGRSIHDVLFRLPDFGPKRRVVIKVLSEDGVPVSGALVQDSGLDPANQVAANSGAHNTRDAAGQVVLSLWPVASYRLTATLWGHRQLWSGDPLAVEAGQPDVKETIVLKGLRLKHGR